MNRWIPSGKKAQHPSLFPDQSDTEINNAMMLLIGWKITFGAKCQTCCAEGVWMCEKCMCGVCRRVQYTVYQDNLGVKVELFIERVCIHVLAPFTFTVHTDFWPTCIPRIPQTIQPQ